MIRFHQVLDATIEAVRHAAAGALQGAEAIIIRDIGGRIQLLVDRIEPVDQAVLEHLKESLNQHLGPYFSGMVWLKKDKRDNVFAALQRLVNEQKQPLKHSTEPDRPGDPEWYIVERHVSKSSWTARAGQPPWQLQPQTPAIVAFHSFKGGVGRTTALAMTAAIMARRGACVAVIDFDLEAPGLETILLPEADPMVGMVDYLLEKPILDRTLRLSSMLQACSDAAVIDQGEHITVLGAGEIDSHFLEKLARLDVEGMLLLSNQQEQNPLRQLFKELKAYRELDFILIDCRSGLHDLGGLAVSGLAHLSLLFASDMEQSYRGLNAVVRLLGRPLEEEPIDVKIVHALLPMESTLQQTCRERFRARCYNIFEKHYYRQEDGPDSAPGVDDSQAPHFAIELFDIPQMRIMLPWEGWRIFEPYYIELVNFVIQTTGKEHVFSKG